ncbi:MAG: ROK family transcriptional regulator [Acidobacteria bacterium]|nr:ROK family transcriptional regulator [Acidobacteriota bacterium]
MRKISLENTQAAGKKTIKEVNQKLILNLIREHQPISRVEISNRTELQRSTVTIITERLLNENWVYEGESGPSNTNGGGRRPRNMYLNPDKQHVLGVEVGREQTILAVADLNGKILSRKLTETKRDASVFFPALAKAIKSYARESRLRGPVPTGRSDRWTT